MQNTREACANGITLAQCPSGLGTGLLGRSRVQPHQKAFGFGFKRLTLVPRRRGHGFLRLQPTAGTGTGSQRCSCPQAHHFGLLGCAQHQFEQQLGWQHRTGTSFCGGHGFWAGTGFLDRKGPRVSGPTGPCEIGEPEPVPARQKNRTRVKACLTLERAYS